jgi:ribosomal-protein-alanine N-acetyltransferase
VSGHVKTQEPSWNIRLVQRRDVPDLLVIENAQFPEPWTKGMLLDEIQNVESRRYTVAEQKGKIVGYLGVMFVLDELHINTIGTLPGFERRGIASSLMKEMWPVAVERGITKASLEVAVSNTGAQALYYRFGFAPVGVRKNYYERTHEDALVLWAKVEPLAPTL